MMRIDKYLAEMGQGTRSEIKKLIRSGRVMVDGETVKKPELKIDETTQKVSLEGKQIGYAKKSIICSINRQVLFPQQKMTGTRQFWI